VMHSDSMTRPVQTAATGHSSQGAEFFTAHDHPADYRLAVTEIRCPKIYGVGRAKWDFLFV